MAGAPTIGLLSLPENVVLALLCEGDSHGFALSRMLSGHGEIGSIYSVARPAVYRAIGRLEAAGLVERHGTEPGDAAPARTVLGATAAGFDVAARWLAEPVGHVRDMRTAFLVKLALLERAGGDRRPLVAAQRVRLTPIAAALTGPAPRPAGGASDGPDPVVTLWRRTSADAALRFLDELDRLDA